MRRREFITLLGGAAVGWPLLQGAGVVAIVGELEAAGVSKHVWMHGKRHLGGLAEALNEMMKAHRTDRPATLGNKYIGFARVLRS
jgi:hypothetical protein